KRERASRGISLQEISGYTRIGVRQLQALEEGQLDRLPGGIFNRSFVRQYARYLGLNEDQLVSEYLQAVGNFSEFPVAPAAYPHQEQTEPADGGSDRIILTVVSLVVAVVAILYAIHMYTGRRSSSNLPALSAASETAGAAKEALSPSQNPLQNSP